MLYNSLKNTNIFKEETMKKGFTMIELIFVIVILGILAAVAIPRLAATRDDAEIAKAATNISTLLSDIGAYYTSQGKFADDISKMTNVPLEVDGTNKLLGQMTVAGKKCIKFTLAEPVTTAGDTKGKPAVIKVENGTDSAAGLCPKVLGSSAVEKIKTSKFKFVNASGAEKESAEGEYPVSGLSVAF